MLDGTVAKDLLYKAILEEIKTTKSDFRNFNIGISTALLEPSQRWSDPYRHWRFIPKDYTFRKELTKGNKKPRQAYNISDA